MLGIALLIWGIYVIASAKVQFSSTRSVTGTPARAIGLTLVLAALHPAGLLLTIVATIAAAFLAQQNEPGSKPASPRPPMSQQRPGGAKPPGTTGRNRANPPGHTPQA